MRDIIIVVIFNNMEHKPITSRAIATLRRFNLHVHRERLDVVIHNVRASCPLI